MPWCKPSTTTGLLTSSMQWSETNDALGAYHLYFWVLYSSYLPMFWSSILSGNLRSKRLEKIILKSNPFRPFKSCLSFLSSFYFFLFHDYEVQNCHRKWWCNNDWSKNRNNIGQFILRFVSIMKNVPLQLPTTITQQIERNFDYTWVFPCFSSLYEHFLTSKLTLIRVLGTT